MSQKKELDWSQFRFPSDQVTLGKIREVEPELFTPTGLLKDYGDIRILAALSLEMELAENAFAKAAGRPLPQRDFNESRQERVLMLNDEYKAYGISSGLQQTRQLVRDFEAAAARQAESGKSR